METTTTEASASDTSIDDALAPPESPDASDCQPCTFWTSFGLCDVAADGSAATLPDGIVVYTHATDADEAALRGIVKAFPCHPGLATSASSRSHYFYRIGADARYPDSSTLPAGVRLLQAGDRIELPVGDSFTPDRYVKSIDHLSELNVRTVEEPAPKATVRPEMRTPLSAFSLRGQATKFEEKMVSAVPVLGDLCLAGQSTVWYAAPNAGKTLIALRLLFDAIDKGHLTAGNA